MAEKPAIVFKSEPALWDQLARVNPDGRSARPFDFRRWDMADDRIYRLAWGSVEFEDGKVERTQRAYRLGGRPDEKEVSFLNKATGELLTFEYLGVEFVPWAPGWGFLLLGKRLHPPVHG
jgi:hypothetical protein